MLRALRLFLVTFLPTLRSRLRGGPARPSWGFAFEWSIRMLRRDWDETASWPLTRVRQLTAERPAPRPHVGKVAVTDERLGGVEVRRFTPASPAKLRVVFFHGGSYIYGSTRHSHAELCAHLALASGCEVVGVEYRLAPEHVWPAQLDDAKAVCAALEGPVVLAGDSAGGHLATFTALTHRPLALVLLSPWVDLEMPGASFTTNDRFDFGTREVLTTHARAVAGATPLADLALSRLPLAGLPPTFVSVGGAEVPHDDIVAFAARLRAAGVEVTQHVADDMPHNPLLFEGLHPNARAAFDAAVAFVKRLAGSC
ncbi:MAG: alpha/beta hydrolase [Myxococcaceae bacterium]|nr:alpha/beta hydrolase [Myxococcaceae bacterium]